MPTPVTCEKGLAFFKKKIIVKNGSQWHNSARKAKNWGKAKFFFNMTSALVKLLHQTNISKQFFLENAIVCIT